MMAWGPVYPVMPGERILYVDQMSSAFAQTFRRMIKGQQGQKDLLNLPFISNELLLDHNPLSPLRTDGHEQRCSLKHGLEPS